MKWWLIGRSCMLTSNLITVSRVQASTSGMTLCNSVWCDFCLHKSLRACMHGIWILLAWQSMPSKMLYCATAAMCCYAWMKLYCAPIRILLYAHRISRNNITCNKHVLSALMTSSYLIEAMLNSSSASVQYHFSWICVCVCVCVCVYVQYTVLLCPIILCFPPKVS